jgi:ketosteroid isomerase-like protein
MIGKQRWVNMDRRNLMAGAGAAVTAALGTGAPERLGLGRGRPEVVSRLERAMSSGDADKVAACFAVDFTVMTPLHPSRGFTGNEQVRKNWAGIFAQVPDHRGRLLRWSRGADGSIWTEWSMTGTTVAGTPYRAGGPAILTIRHGVIAAARFYLDQVGE